MPQMSPMKWLYILIMTFMNLILLKTIMNSMPKKIKIKKLMKSNMLKWKWLW